MSAAVAQLLEEALRLPGDSRTELVEAILECSQPAPDFIDQQMTVVAGRMERVRAGLSTLVPASEAHERVLQFLQPRA